MGGLPGELVSNKFNLSIVLVNYNTGKQLKDCLESINSSPCHFLDKIVVIDNASTDGSLKFLKKNNDVKVIKNKENLGFGRACNQGAACVDSDYILFLNPDTIITADSISAIVCRLYYGKEDNIAVCGLKQIDQENNVSRHCCEFPSMVDFLWRSIGLTSIFPRLGHVLTEWDHLESREVDHVIGSCYAIRRDVFEELKGFDERFFLYYEDLDLSKRVMLSGWKIFYDAEHQLTHFCGGSSKSVPVQRLFRSLQSKLIYVDKHHGIHQFKLLLFFNLFIEFPLRIILNICNLKLTNFNNTFSSFLLLIKWSKEFCASKK
jgi:GT2 family glycosyltransferase